MKPKDDWIEFTLIFRVLKHTFCTHYLIAIITYIWSKNVQKQAIFAFVRHVWTRESVVAMKVHKL